VAGEGRAVTFSREARRVLDPSLPLDTRVVGLRCCLRHYHPIGFEASFSFLNRREAALHAVWFWYSKGASADVDVHCLAAALVQRGRFTAAQRAMFDEVRADLRARLAAVDGTRDYQTYDVLRSSLAVVAQMAVVVGA